MTERIKVWDSEKGCFVDQDQHSGGRRQTDDDCNQRDKQRQKRGGPNPGQHRGTPRGQGEQQGNQGPTGQGRQRGPPRGQGEQQGNQGPTGQGQQRGPPRGQGQQQGNRGPTGQGQQRGHPTSRGQGHPNSRGQGQNQQNQWGNQGHSTIQGQFVRDNRPGLHPNPPPPPAQPYYGQPPIPPYIYPVIQHVVPVYDYGIPPPPHPNPLYSPPYPQPLVDFSQGQGRQGNEQNSSRNEVGSRSPDYRNNRRPLSRAASSMSVDNAGRDESSVGDERGIGQRGRGRVRGGRGSNRGSRNNSEGNMQRSYSTMSINSTGSTSGNIRNDDVFGDNRRIGGKQNIPSYPEGFREQFDERKDSGARPKQTGDNIRQRIQSTKNIAGSGRRDSRTIFNSWEEDNQVIEGQDRRNSYVNEEKEPIRQGPVRGGGGRGRPGTGRRPRGRANVRQEHRRRPFYRGNDGRKHPEMDQFDNKSDRTLSDQENDVDDTLSNDKISRRIEVQHRGRRGRFRRGGTSRRGRSGYNNEANRANVNAENPPSAGEVGGRQGGGIIGRGSRSIRGRWTGYVPGRIKTDSLSEAGSIISLDEDDLDDNESVTSNATEISYGCADDERETIKLDDLLEVKIQTLKNRITRYKKKLAEMKKKNESEDKIKNFQSQIEQISRVIMERGENKHEAKLIKDENLAPKQETYVSSKSQKSHSLQTKKSKISFRPKAKKAKEKSSVGISSNANDEEATSENESEKIFDNDFEEIDEVENIENLETGKENVKTKRKRMPKKKRNANEQASSNVESKNEDENIISALAIKLENLLKDNLGTTQESRQKNVDSLDDLRSTQESKQRKEDIKTDNKRRNETDREPESTSDLSSVDEVEIFKFLVKNLEGHGTPEEIRRESGLFPVDFDVFYWFKKHGRRFIVIGNDFDSSSILAFYKQATYCKFYLTSKSCQKKCGRYHICKDFLAGSCKFGESKCRFSHDFFDEKNSPVSKDLGFFSVFTNDEICSIMRVRFPRVCPTWAENGLCNLSNCVGLHLCPRNLLGKCLEGKECPLNHEKMSDHNRSIIEAYGMSQLPDNMFRQLVYIVRKSANETDVDAVSTTEEESKHSSDVPEEVIAERKPRKKPGKTDKAVDIPIELSDTASQKSICEAFLRDKCTYPKCRNMHTSTKMPYLWQLHLSGAWVNLENSEEIEKEYCERNEESSFFQMRHHDIELRVRLTFGMEKKALILVPTTDEGGTMCDWRRLSTPSFTDKNISKDAKGGCWKTQWRWYWQDDLRRWSLFEPDALQHTLEMKFIANQKYFCYSRENYRFKYMMDFTTMNQLNIDTAKNRPILRRPCFVSKDDVLNSHFAGSLVDAPDIETKLPPGWVPWDLAHPFELVLLDTTETDYVTVSEKFYATLRRSQQTIEAIYRLQNHKLWGLFCSYQKTMEANLKRVGKDCPVETRYLFHGTDSLDAVRGISINNFDVRVSGKNATMYGDGAYFARDAKYSHSYTKPPERFMFVAKVLVGEFTKGNKEFRRPPQKPGATHELYDSCVNDVLDPSIFIVFDKNQYYPEYLIQYKNVQEEVLDIGRKPVPAQRPVTSTSSVSSSGVMPTSPSYKPTSTAYQAYGQTQSTSSYHTPAPPVYPTHGQSQSTSSYHTPAPPVYPTHGQSQSILVYPTHTPSKSEPSNPVSSQQPPSARISLSSPGSPSNDLPTSNTTVQEKQKKPDSCCIQ